MPTIGGNTALGGEGKKGIDCDTNDTERSSISTSSSATSSSYNGHGGSNWTSNSANKLSKFGRRIRDSCRNLKGKHQQNGKYGVASGASHNPEDYDSFQLPSESIRSKVYVAMDFSGRQGGRILDNPKDVRACDKVSTAAKDGYVPFRRRLAQPVNDRLTDTQAKVHKYQPWFHWGMSRDKANKILQAHANTDGVFLVRESSVAGGFVISYTVAGKNIHSQVLPITTSDGVVYSLDDGKTKFYDLLQLVEFYQLNTGCLPTRLKHYIANLESGPPSPSPDTEKKGSDLWSRNGESSRQETDGAFLSGACKDPEEGPESGLGDLGGPMDRAHSPDSVKMAASGATSEADSAMSQDGGSEDEGSNREQQG